MCGRREEKLLFHRKKEKKGSTGYDPSICSPVLRCSICTGEQVAGFRDNATGKFREVMLIRSEADLDTFRKEYGIEGEIQKIY